MHGIAGLQGAENEQVQRPLQEIDARQLSHWCRSSTPINNAPGVECQHQRRGQRARLWSKATGLRPGAGSGFFHPIDESLLGRFWLPMLKSARAPPLTEHSSWM